MTTSPDPGPLAGIRILDLAADHGAYAGRLMADLGAEVIRVEPPTGDPLRRAGPHAQARDGRVVGVAHTFLNAGKKAVSLDLACADGRRLFGELAARADVLIETFTPGTLAAWRLDYETLRARNPRLVMVSITPFGQTGPRSRDRATDVTLLAAGGLLSLGGYVDTGPVAVPGEQARCGAAIFGAVATLSALLERDSTGEGQWIDVSAQECVAFALEDAIPEWYINHAVRQRTGDRAREAGTGVYPCRDGYISLVAGRLGTAKAFVSLTEWIADSGVPGGEELRDPRWQDFKYRQSEDGILRFQEIFGAFCATRGKQELYREGQARQIAIAPVNTVADVCESEQLAATGFFHTRFDPELGREVTFPGPPYRLSASPAAIRSAAPQAGEHNREVFVGELGLTDDALGALVAAGVV